MSFPPIIGSIEINWWEEDGTITLRELPIIDIVHVEGEMLGAVCDYHYFESPQLHHGSVRLYSISQGISQRVDIWFETVEDAAEDFRRSWEMVGFKPLHNVAKERYPDRLPVRGTVKEVGPDA